MATVLNLQPESARVEGSEDPWAVGPVTDAPTPDSPPTRLTVWSVAALALALVVVGGLTVRLATTRGLFAVPIAAGAGLALVAVWRFGRSGLVAVFIGATLLAALTAGWDWPLTPASGLAVPSPSLLLLLHPLGLALQALVGASLLRRFGITPALTEPREVVMFALLAGALACTVQASLATLGVWASGFSASPWPGSWADLWVNWWVADTLGVLLIAPMVLALLNRPSVAWQGRRLGVMLPMAVMVLVLAVAGQLAQRWSQERAHVAFSQAADAAATGLGARMTRATDAVQALSSVYVASESVTASEFRAATQHWLSRDRTLVAMGYSERVAVADLDRWSRAAAAEDGFPMSVHPPPRPDNVDPIVIRHVEPMDRNAPARGLLATAVPTARLAMLRAIDGGMVAATAPFRLAQHPEDPSGVVLYRAVYANDQSPSVQRSPFPEERQAAWRGVVFVTLRLSHLLASARDDGDLPLRWCLYDSGQRVPMAGEPDCADGLAQAADAQRAFNGLVKTRHFSVGGRDWAVVLSADTSRTLPSALRPGEVGLLSLAALMAGGSFAALLLALTGRARRIEQAVQARTLQWQSESLRHRRTADALRDSEHQLRSIVDQVPAGIVFTDPHGRIRQVNPWLCDLLQAPAASLVGQPLATLVHRDDRQVLAEATATLHAASADDSHAAVRLGHPGRQEHAVELTLSRLVAQPGQPAWGWVVLVQDVTERRRRKQAEQDRQAAEAANRAKSEFLSRMSHELRTPLNAMLGFTQLLQMDRRAPLPPHQRHWIRQALAAGWHLLDMISDVLDLSRIDAGSMRLRAEPVDLLPLIGQCLALVEQAARERRVTLHLEPPAQLLRVFTDPTRLKQVITNLLTNGIKYNRPGGTVRVSVQQGEDGRVAVQVQDDGLGMSEAQQARLFRPFERLGREHSGVEGTGIGLVISLRLAELMGGALAVRSAAGQGSTFTLSLPPAQAVNPAASPDGAGADPAADALSPAAQRPCRVLCIEDQSANAELIRGTLATRPQWTLQTCGTGSSGLATARARPPDLILLDMGLPDQDGLTVLQQLAQDPATAGIPVLVLSADAGSARRDAALAAGAREYLTKPLDITQLLDRIDALLAAPVGAQAGQGEAAAPSAPTPSA